MQATKLIQLTITEEEFNSIRDSLGESSTYWCLKAYEAKDKINEGARLIYDERYRLREKFNDHYRNLFVLKSSTTSAISSHEND